MSDGRLNHDCDGKTPYPSKAAALSCLQHRTKDRRTKRRDGRGKLGAYRCRNCSQWHLGSFAF